MNKPAPLCKLHSKHITLFGGGIFGCINCSIDQAVELDQVPRLREMKCSEYGILSDKLPLEIQYGDSYVSMKDPPLYDLVFHLLSSERDSDLMVLSELYRIGYGLVKNTDKALELLKAASLTNQMAAERLAQFYISRNDLKSADSVLRTDSATGYGLYIKAIINKKKGEMKEYYRLIQKSADKGHPNSITLHGLHRMGFESVCQVDYNEAIDYLIRAPDTTIRDAILAIMYFNGDGTGIDIPRACEYALRVVPDKRPHMVPYVSACRSILEYAQMDDILSNCKTKEEGISQLEEEISKGKGWPYKYGLVNIYLSADANGKVGGGTHEEYEKAFSLCSDIVSEVPFAAFVISYLYEKGLGCEKSIEKAIQFMKIASSVIECEYETIRLEYIRDSEMGKPVSDDTLRILGESRDTHAQMSLANLLVQNGDYNNAFKIYEKGVAASFMEAYYSKGCMLIRGLGCERDVISGCEVLSEARNFSPSLYPLGLCCYDGIFYDKNVRRSLNMLKEAHKKTRNPDIIKAIKTILNRENLRDQIGQWVSE